MAEQLIELNVTGMHCNNCAISVHRLLEKKGFHDISVDFASEEVKFTTGDHNAINEAIKSIEGLGYKVIEDAELHHEKFYEKIENKLLFCTVFTIPLLSAMLLPWHLLR